MRKRTEKKTLAFGLSLTLAFCSAVVFAEETAIPDTESVSQIFEQTSEDSEIEEEASEIEEEESETTAEEEEPVFVPVTVKDALNRTVTITKKPQTIICMNAVASSMIVGLGLGEALASIPSNPFNWELYRSIHPDLLIIPSEYKSAVSILESYGLTVLAIHVSDQDSIWQTLRMIGTATNTLDAGTAIQEYVDFALLALDDTLTDSGTPSVYLAGASDVLSTAGSSIFPDTLIEQAHGINAASELTEADWVHISYGQLLGWNPDYILLPSNAEYTVESVRSDENLATCTAVLKNQIFQIPNQIEALDMPIPASFLGSIWLSSILHPDRIDERDYTEVSTEFYETYYGFTPDLNTLQMAY